MKISVAMATFNGARFLREQLDSLARQTRRPDELVVTDDRSSDATLVILEAFARTAPFRVSVSVNDHNLGYGQNFSRAMSRTTGDLVFLADQDDVWDPEKLETVVGLAEAHPRVQCILNDARMTDAQLVPLGITKLERIRQLGQPDTSFVMGCCAAVRQEFLHVAVPLPAGLPAHDSWIVGLSDTLGTTLRFETPLQDYRRHGANASQTVANQTHLRSRLGMVGRKGFAKLRSLTHSDLLLKEHEFAHRLDETIASQRQVLSKMVSAAELDQVADRLHRRVMDLGYRVDLRSLSRPARANRLLRDALKREPRLRWRNAVKDLATDRIDRDTCEQRWR